MLHTSSRSSTIGRLLLAAALTLGFASASAPAIADDTDEDTIRWSVTPADESGPDGRRAVEIELDPGETADDLFAVRNVSEVEVTFRLTAADGFYTRNGRFDILPADQESVDAGTWITIPEEVTVGAGETAVVPFDISVPENAEPGDHAAGITASVLSTQTGDGGASVGVESRVGFRVTTRVTGEITPEAVVDAVVGDYATSWNPLRPGELTVTFDVENTGNTILLIEGSVNAGGQSAGFPAEGENPQELLPGDSRSFTVLVDDVWPLFAVPVSVVVTPTMLTMAGDTSAIEPVVADITVWAMPWPQLIVLAGLALVVWALVWGRIRSRRRLQTMLADAKEAGRREAGEAGDAS
ncbi:WxL protein peptidoglycan domain-containing protein [Microbacterium sp. HJ5]